MSGKAYGYLFLFAGYIITGVGIYYLSYAKGSYNCTPYGDYFNECRNIGTDAAPKFARSRYIPNDYGAEDPDKSVKYILQEDVSQCPKQDCKVGPWTPDGECYTTDPTTNTKKQNWKRTILQKDQYGGTPCPKITATVNCGNSPEPFRFLRRRRRIKLGIEGDANYGGGIAGIVFGCIFMIIGHTLVFTTGK